jgi:hypothetical protein
MAIVVRVKREELIEGAMDIAMPTQGTVRGIVHLWYEQPSPPAAPGIPMTRSDKALVVGDDIGPTTGPQEQRYGQPLITGHIQRLGGWEAFLTERGLSLDDYITNRNFQVDLAVPAEIIDAYTG